MELLYDFLEKKAEKDLKRHNDYSLKKKIV